MPSNLLRVVLLATKNASFQCSRKVEYKAYRSLKTENPGISLICASSNAHKGFGRNTHIHTQHIPPGVTFPGAAPIGVRSPVLLGVNRPKLAIVWFVHISSKISPLCTFSGSCCCSSFYLGSFNVPIIMGWPGWLFWGGGGIHRTFCYFASQKALRILNSIILTRKVSATSQQNLFI